MIPITPIGNPLDIARDFCDPHLGEAQPVNGGLVETVFRRAGKILLVGFE